MDKDELLRRVVDKEDNHVERKLEGVHSRDIRKTLVAFANSVSEGRVAILYIGVSDNGDIRGVSNSDELQKRVRDVAHNQCYPKIDYQCEIIEVECKEILAVMVGASTDRPHFAGPAYVRIGSESLCATPELYEDLIASRNTKARAILQFKNSRVTVTTQGKQLGVTKRLGDAKYRETCECDVVACTAHVVRLRVVNSQKDVCEPLGSITISHDTEKSRLLLIVADAN